MIKKDVYSVPTDVAKNAWIHAEQYHSLYQQSLNEPEKFWGEQARNAISWFSEWEKVLSGDLSQQNVRWFSGAKLNVAYNCLDRHLTQRAHQAAIIWQGDNPTEILTLTYHDLHKQVCQFANVLKKYGVKKGDRVCIYLPMISEAAIAMLACARIGAIHTVVFSAFSTEALKSRLIATESQIIITANESIRGNKSVALKHNVDAALKDNKTVKHVIVVKRTNNKTAWVDDRDIWYHDAMSNVDADCPAEIMDAQDPLFILYTSGSTGKPKGIVHGTAGYLLYAAMTHKIIFDYHDNDIFWCTADIGWITGHTYTVYGPLVNGGTTLLFEGVPHYPSFARFWEIIDQHKVTIFYTAPTAIRALRKEGDEWVKKTNRSSLRLLGSVGEPINPEAWKWYSEVVGEQRCPIVDTWWQTETGGIMLSAFPGATPLKPGSAAWPFFGVVPEIVDDNGKPVADGKMGNLVITQAWPGMMQTVYQDPKRFFETYFSQFPGRYLTGDQAYRDADGYFWISGRSDDVLKVSGHRIGSEEVESSLIQHSAVSEAAVVGIPDEIKGQSIYAFVTLKNGITPTDNLKKELIQTVREAIGPIATPNTIQWAEGLPKTRSGKIMRRLLHKIAMQDTSEMGDLSTLADPAVVDVLVKGREKMLVK